MPVGIFPYESGIAVMVAVTISIETAIIPVPIVPIHYLNPMVAIEPILPVGVSGLREHRSARQQH